MEQPIQNTEEQMTDSKKRYTLYRESILAAQKRYYQKNAEKKREYQRHYRAMKLQQKQTQSE